MLIEIIMLGVWGVDNQIYVMDILIPCQKNIEFKSVEILLLDLPNICLLKINWF